MCRALIFIIFEMIKIKLRHIPVLLAGFDVTKLTLQNPHQNVCHHLTYSNGHISTINSPLDSQQFDKFRIQLSEKKSEFICLTEKPIIVLIAIKINCCQYLSIFSVFFRPSPPRLFCCCCCCCHWCCRLSERVRMCFFNLSWKIYFYDHNGRHRV
jgi:hypothetical protein